MTPFLGNARGKHALITRGGITYRGFHVLLVYNGKPTMAWPPPVHTYCQYNLALLTLVRER